LETAAVTGVTGTVPVAICKLGLEGIVSKKIDALYRSGPSKTWIKVKNPKAPAATRVLEGGF
jgi:bifunctional non-homologous end joining protein LigD